MTGAGQASTLGFRLFPVQVCRSEPASYCHYACIGRHRNMTRGISPTSVQLMQAIDQNIWYQMDYHLHDVKPMVQTIKMFEAVQKQEVSSRSS